MKIKADFVTNSSSSAFVVFWPHPIESSEDVGQYIQRQDFVDQIFKDAKSQQTQVVPPVKEARQLIHKIADEIDHGYLKEVDDEYGYDWNYDEKFCAKHGITKKQLEDNFQWREQMWQEQHEIKKQRCIVVATKIVQEHEGKYVYFFEYADEDGSFFAALEHENNWGGQPHVRISKH